MTTIRVFLIATTIALLLGESPAQRYRQQDAREQARRQKVLDQLKEREQQRRRENAMMFPQNTAPKGAPFQFQLGNRKGLQQMFPRYDGLPTYPSNVPGYGGYPGAGDKTGTGLGPGGLGVLGLRPTNKDRWPSWIEGGTGAGDQKVRSNQAVLIRLTDRVWLRPSGERAFIPLAFYDRFRFMEPGSQVEVRGKGEFQLVLHDGGSLRSRGPCSLQIAGLNDESADLQLANVQNVLLTAKLRPLRVRLPDGTQLEFVSGGVHLERRGDSIRVSNAGSSPIRYNGSLGSGEILGPKFIRIWVAPPRIPPLSDALQLTGRVSQSKSGPVTTIRGGDQGRVTWSGASFVLGEGATLQLQPLKAHPSQTRR